MKIERIVYPKLGIIDEIEVEETEVEEKRMTKTEYLDQICAAMGIDISLFPDRLLTTYLSAIATQLGVDISALEGCTLPDWLETIRDNAGNVGGGGSGITETIIYFSAPEGQSCTALSGQSVGSWVEIQGYMYDFIVEDGVVYYCGEPTKSLATDLITEGFEFKQDVRIQIYDEYKDNGDKSYSIENGMTFEDWCASDGNTDGYYINSNGYLCNAEGRLVVYSDMGVGYWYTVYRNSNFNVEDWITYYILPAKSVSFQVEYFEYFAPSGYTWDDFINDSFLSGYYEFAVTDEGDVVRNGGSVMHNGANVHSTDAIIEGAYYEIQW